MRPRQVLSWYAGCESKKSSIRLKDRFRREGVPCSRICRVELQGVGSALEKLQLPNLSVAAHSSKKEQWRMMAIHTGISALTSASGYDVSSDLGGHDWVTIRETEGCTYNGSQTSEWRCLTDYRFSTRENVESASKARKYGTSCVGTR